MAAKASATDLETTLNHVDLYDRVNMIPFAKLTAYFSQHLAQSAKAA